MRHHHHRSWSLSYVVRSTGRPSTRWLWMAAAAATATSTSTTTTTAAAARNYMLAAVSSTATSCTTTNRTPRYGRSRAFTTTTSTSTTSASSWWRSLRGGGNNSNSNSDLSGVDTGTAAAATTTRRWASTDATTTTTPPPTPEFETLAWPAPGNPFHFAFPVHDLAAAEHFYGTILNCPQGRTAPGKWTDFSLGGHQIVCHYVGADYRAPQYYNPVDGDEVPVPHAGLALTVPEFHALAERLQQAGIQFMIEPHLRFQGMPGEQYTMFFQDPSGNSLEFKAMTQPQNLFAKYNVVDQNNDEESNNNNNNNNNNTEADK